MKTPDQLVTASDFLEFFEAIPDEKWCVGTFGVGDVHCAHGHLGQTINQKDGIPPVIRLRDALGAEMVMSVSGINDGADMSYRQPTPKARICAALRDAIAQGK